MSPSPVPDPATVGRLYASYGVTAVHDATPESAGDKVEELSRALHDGLVPQRVTLPGAGRGPRPGEEGWTRGPYKLLPPGHDMWTYDELVRRIRTARGSGGRPVAVHAVTREALVLTLVALGEVGPSPGGRIEHAAGVPRELLPRVGELGLRVVTQPGFIAERGDHYAADVEPEDLPHRSSHASLLAAGIPVSPSTDAPHSPGPEGRGPCGTRPPYLRRTGTRIRKTRQGVGNPDRRPLPAAGAVEDGL